MLDVAVRVHTIRPFAVQQMALLLENPFVIFGFTGGNSRVPNMTQVLYAAAWICGEFVEYVERHTNFCWGLILISDIILDSFQTLLLPYLQWLIRKWLNFLILYNQYTSITA
jgi:hypothetical protein